MPWEHTGCQKGAASPPDGRQDTSETAQFHWFGLAIALCHEGQGDFSIVRLDGTKDGHGMDGWMDGIVMHLLIIFHVFTVQK